MKPNLIILCLLLIAYASNAQQREINSDYSQFHLGVGLTSVTYHIYYDNSQLPGDVKSGYFTPVMINAGYTPNKKFRFQLGLGYGGSNDQMSWSPNHRDSDTIKYNTSSRTHVLVIPITAQVVMFKALKRFPIYATGSIVTALGKTNAEVRETVNGVTNLHSFEESGINLFAIAGFGFNYKISQRFDGYVEWLPFKNNLTGQNSFHYDWEQFSSKGRRFYKSLGLGINYKLHTSPSSL